MTKAQVIQSLYKQAQNHRHTANDLFKAKHYDWCLFLWHLAIEKLLKAKIIASGKELIYTHNIYRLYKQSNLLLSPKLKHDLDTITTFNIEARYDDYKLSFYKKATKEYTKKWIIICTSVANSIQK